MAHYVVADIHGEADRFYAMLEKIAFAMDLENRGEHLKIYHGPGFIDIDCGCGYDMPIKALACIRLEDMVEYYQ